MSDITEYDLETPVVVEDSFLGERYRFEAAAGRVKPSNEYEELALAALAAANPDVCRVVKPSAKPKG